MLFTGSMRLPALLATTRPHSRSPTPPSGPPEYTYTLHPWCVCNPNNCHHRYFNNEEDLLMQRIPDPNNIIDDITTVATDFNVQHAAQNDYRMFDVIWPNNGIDMPLPPTPPPFGHRQEIPIRIYDINNHE